MRKTIVELLKENMNIDGTYPKDFKITDNSHLDIFDDNELILDPNDQKVLSLDEFIRSLSENEDVLNELDEEAAETFIKQILELGSNYYLDNIIILFDALEKQFNETGKFKEVTLRELGDYTVGEYGALYEAYTEVVTSDKYGLEFLLNLGNALLNDSKDTYEFNAAFYILSNLEYKDVKKHIHNIDHVLSLIQNLKDWRFEYMASVYKWELNDLLYELLRQEAELESYQYVSMFFQMFSPLRDEVAIYLANNVNLVQHVHFYSQYIDVDRFLVSKYSLEMFVPALAFVLSDEGKYAYDYEKDKRDRLDKVLVDVLLTKDIPFELYDLVYQFKEILETKDISLHEKLLPIFEDIDLHQFVEEKMKLNKTSWQDLYNYIQGLQKPILH